MQQNNLDREAIAKNLEMVANAIGYPTSEFVAQKFVNSLTGNDLLMGFGKRKRSMRSYRKKAKGFGYGVPIENG